MMGHNFYIILTHHPKFLFSLFPSIVKLITSKFINICTQDTKIIDTWKGTEGISGNLGEHLHENGEEGSLIKQKQVGVRAAIVGTERRLH